MDWVINKRIFLIEWVKLLMFDIFGLDFDIVILEY